MAWTLLQYEIFQQLELWHEKESALCHRNDKYWSSLENQLARLRSIIHHKSHHEMTYFALYLFTLCSHFTTLPHLTWLRVVKTPGSGSWLSPECRSRLRPELWQAAGPPYTGWKQTPKLQSEWRHLYPILSSHKVPLQSPVLFMMLDYVSVHIKYSALTPVSRWDVVTPAPAPGRRLPAPGILDTRHGGIFYRVTFRMMLLLLYVPCSSMVIYSPLKHLIMLWT